MLPFHMPLRIFVGWDERETVAFHTFAHSLVTRASGPVSVIALKQDTLRKCGLYTRSKTEAASTQFAFTRFLVPYLSSFTGYSVFADCDMLALTDVYDGLMREIVKARHHATFRQGREEPAVLVCQHDYVPKASVKMDGQRQVPYPRKNWSSFMVFNNERCKALSPTYVNHATGAELHRFQWLEDADIGALPLEWNWLVGEYEPNPNAKILHFTEGGPWFPGYETCDHADLWTAERDAALGVKVAA